MWSNGLTESTSGFDVALCLGSATTHMLELKIPPVLTGAVTAMGMWPRLPPLAHISFALARVVAVGMGLTGVIITGLAMLSFWRAHTTANPMKPHRHSS